MWARSERGAASMEHVAMLLIAALFVGAVVVGIKPEWVRYKVCQALVAVSGEGSCTAPAKPPAQTPPKPCVTNSSSDSTTIHAEGQIIWVKVGGEASYGYRYKQYSDGTVDVELYYAAKGELGAGKSFGGDGEIAAKVGVTGSVKYEQGETFHYDSLADAQAAQSKLKDYAKSRALATIGLGSQPTLDGAQHTSTSDVWEFGVSAQADVGVNPGGKTHESTAAGLGGQLDGKVSVTTVHDEKTGNVTTKIETLGSVKGSATVNTPGSGPHVSANATGQLEAKTSVSVTKDKSGNIVELVITKSSASGSGTSVEVGTGDTGMGKHKPKHASDEPAGPSDPNYTPRHAAPSQPDVDGSGKNGGDDKGRTTTTYRLAVNDQNRAQVIAWLGGDGIGATQAPGLLVKSAFINPLDVNTTDDFAKFLRTSQDAQIDAQTTTESSSSDDKSLDLGVVSGGIKNDTESTSSTGQTYWVLENGQRVPKPAVGCK